jgi:hypothetical protein
MRLAAELRLEVGKLGAAAAGAGGVAALGHEAGDDAVEGDAVVEALLGELLDPLDMAGREVGPEPDDDVAAAVEIEHQGIELVGHVSVSMQLSRGDLGALPRMRHPRAPRYRHGWTRGLGRRRSERQERGR